MTNAAKILQDARQANGLSYSQVRLAVFERLGAYTPTEQTIINYHRADKAPSTPDPVLLCALADVYGIELSLLMPDFQRIQELWARSRCST